MPVAIILGFDEESTNILNQVFKKLKESKFNSYYQLVVPHVTLTSYENIDLQVAMERLKQFCDGVNPFNLLDIQQKVFDLLEDFQVDDSPKTWVPHCTLATDVPIKKIGKAIDIVKGNIIMKMGAPFYVDAQSICTVEFKTGPLTIISTYEFKFKKTK